MLTIRLLPKRVSERKAIVGRMERQNDLIHSAIEGLFHPSLTGGAAKGAPQVKSSRARCVVDCVRCQCIDRLLSFTREEFDSNRRAECCLFVSVVVSNNSFQNLLSPTVDYDEPTTTQSDWHGAVQESAERSG